MIAPIVLDTMVATALINKTKRPEAAARYLGILDGRPRGLSFASVSELPYGALKAGWGKSRHRGLERDLDEYTVIKPSDEILTKCAEVRWTAFHQGHALSQRVHDSDKWIAATALHLDLDLISDDRVFRKFPGLRLVRPGRS